MNIPYAVSGAAIACTVGLAVYHELPPLAAETALIETAAPKSAPEPPISHPVRTIPIVASPVVAQVILPVAAAPEQQAIAAAVRPEMRRATKTENPRKIATGDVCARHGGQRVDDPARRSWHCVFSRRAK